MSEHTTEVEGPTDEPTDNHKKIITVVIVIAAVAVALVVGILVSRDGSSWDENPAMRLMKAEWDKQSTSEQANACATVDMLGMDTVVAALRSQIAEQAEGDAADAIAELVTNDDIRDFFEDVC